MADDVLVFIGSLNRASPAFKAANGAGLSVWRFDEATLAVEKLAETAEVDNPSFLSVTADGRIYAVSEVAAWREGVVTAYRFDRAGRRLDYVNKQPALGSVTAHNSLTRDGSKLLVANYGEGAGGPDQSVAVLGIRDDGGLTPPLGSIRHEGTGPDPARQERSHAHSVTETVAGGLCIVADLGLDLLAAYRIEPDGRLTPVARTATAPASGPRHLALHPNGRFVFVSNELDSTVAALALDPATGALALIDTQPAVPAEAREGNYPADIQLSPDARFLYASNRGHDSIATFAVDQATGRLARIDLTPCGGPTPRNLCLTPSGRHLFSANQNADLVAIFARDPATGRLTDTGRAIPVGTPMCVKMTPWTSA
jgi:6-phosphogluconolactonase